MAYQAATRMYGCYRREDAAEAETMLDAVAAVLAMYPDDVIRYVTDPRTGLPGRSKFPPNVAEVRQACEAAMEPARVREARERQRAETQKLLEGANVPRQERPTYAELKEKYGPDWGVGRNAPLCERVPVAERKKVPFRTLTDDELRDHYGVRTGEQLIEQAALESRIQAEREARQKHQRSCLAAIQEMK